MPFGIALRRRSTSAPTDAGVLADLAMLEPSGGRVRLGDVWRERPAVLVLLRHFG